LDSWDEIRRRVEMVRKGNLLFNGDFETGTTEGWEKGPYGFTCNYEFSADSGAKLRGNYGGMLFSSDYKPSAYIAYNKVCSFEEYEGYLFICPFKVIKGTTFMGILYGLDDNGNYITQYPIGSYFGEGDWTSVKAILRGFGDITHFKVGCYIYGKDDGGKVYIDEVKLIPLRSLKGHVLADFYNNTSISSLTRWRPMLICIGRCRLESIITVNDVSGTSPTLDVTISTGLFEDWRTELTHSHPQFTDIGTDRLSVDLPEVCWMIVTYSVGGADQSFDVSHHLRLQPY